MYRCLIVLASLALVAAPARASEPVPRASEVNLIDQLSTSTALGQSPWLVMSARGAYQYFTTKEEQRHRLGLFAQPAVFGTLAVLLLLVGFKDTLLTFLGPLKVPLDILAALLHAAGGAAGYLYLADMAFGLTGGSTSTALGLTSPPPTDTGPPGEGAWMVATVSWLLMAFVHTVVWIVFNSIEVAIILSPFPLVDTVLKSFRTSLIALITGAAAIHPALGFVVALPIFLLCLVALPFALRLAVVGWVFCMDYLRRWFGGGSLPARMTAFAMWSLPGAPLLAYGKVDRAPAGLTFTYRRGCVLWRRTIPIPGEPFVAVGTLTPLLMAEHSGSARQMLMFPPRYGRQERAVAEQLGLSRVEDVSLQSSVREVWRSLRERMTGRGATV